MQHRLISKLYFLWSKVLHSIPILLKKSRRRTITLKNSKLKGSKQLTKHTNTLRYVSYSIPLICSLALLLLLSNLFIINSSQANQAHAIDSPDTTTSLSISNPNLSTTVAPGDTGYLSSNITYSANNITNYTLRVTYANGYNSLKQTGSATALTGAGTSGVTGNSLSDNTWGFAWGNTSDVDGTMKYYTMPNYGTTGTSITDGYLAGGSASGVASTTKKLSFAAKFANNNSNSGHYQTAILLSLIATPQQVYNYKLTYDANGGTNAPEAQTALGKTETSIIFTISDTEPTRSGYIFQGWTDNSAYAANKYLPGDSITLRSSAPDRTIYAIWKQITWDTMTTMQQMTTDVCTKAPTGSPKTLTDTRDDSTYTVMKLSDGNCWMTQNLRIVDKEITSADSDVTSNFTIPVSAYWQSVVIKESHAYYNNDPVIGAYYNWYVATAGTGSGIGSTNAQVSICPKGWKLPTRTDYATLYEKYPGSDTPVDWIDSTSSPDGKPGLWFGDASSSDGGAFFPAAGYVDTNLSAPSGVGSGGYYLTSTSYNGDNSTLFKFNSSSGIGFYTLHKYRGGTIRCVAR